jgi:hypothetical protein
MTVQEMKAYLAHQGVETEIDFETDRLYVTHISGWPRVAETPPGYEQYVRGPADTFRKR